MRFVVALALLSVAVPAAANDGIQRNQDQSARADTKRALPNCNPRLPDNQRAREAATRVECRVNRSLPPVVDPTPAFIL